MKAEWINTKERLPTRDSMHLVINKYGHTEAMVYNTHHECWDDAEGDDYLCDATGVKKWLELSEEAKGE